MNIETHLCASLQSVTHPMMNCSLRLPSRLGRSLALGVFATLSLFTVAPIPGQTSLLGSVAYAQAEESAFTRYVRAAFEIEKTRRSLLEQVKQLTGGNVPNNVCQSSSIAQIQPNVRDQVKGICDNFAAQALSIVREKYKLNREEFNRFQRQSQDPKRQAQIEEEIRRLRLQ